MAVLQRDKSTVYGLTSDLLALTTADINETNRALAAEAVNAGLVADEETRALAAEAVNAGLIADEETRALAAELVLTNNLATEVSDRAAAITAEENARIAGDLAGSDRLDVIEGADTVVGSIAKAQLDAQTYADVITAALADGRVTDLETLTATIDGDENTAGSFRKAISDVIGTSPAALDTLAEIAAAMNNDPDLYNTLVNLVNTSISDLNAEILGTATTAMDTLGEVEAALTAESTRAVAAEGVLTTAVADESARAIAAEGVLTAAVSAEEARAIAAAVVEQTLRIAAELAITDRLDIIEGADTVDGSIAKALADAKVYADAAAIAGGAIFIQEVLTVTADKIVLGHEPKNGMIFNFGTVRHTDSNSVSYDIPAIVTATAGGKEFQLYPNASGDFDGLTVLVQYSYTAEV